MEKHQRRRASAFNRELQAARLKRDEFVNDNNDGFNPEELSEWIVAKCEADKTVDSVYLVPAGEEGEVEGGAGRSEGRGGGRGCGSDAR